MEQDGAVVLLAISVGIAYIVVRHGNTGVGLPQFGQLDFQRLTMAVDCLFHVLLACVRRAKIVIAAGRIHVILAQCCQPDGESLLLVVNSLIEVAFAAVCEADVVE